MVARLKRSLPSGLRRWLRWLQKCPDAHRLTIDRASAWRFWWASKPSRQPTGKTPVGVRLKPLGGAEIFLRPGSTDPYVTWEALTIQPHRPTAPPSLIWDLGANIGVTMAYAAHCFPEARIIGLEPDPDNAELARTNLRSWITRCELIEAAAWIENGIRSFSNSGPEDGRRIVTGDGVVVPTLSLNTLSERTGPPDFVKMDIEGAEKSVLNIAVEWARGVREIVVECHGDYVPAQCVDDLQSLGFTVEIWTHRLSVSSVRGIRASDPVAGPVQR